MNVHLKIQTMSKTNAILDRDLKSAGFGKQSDNTYVHKDKTVIYTNENFYKTKGGVWKEHHNGAPIKKK
jgi:hypothetical protein